MVTVPDKHTISIDILPYLYLYLSMYPILFSCASIYLCWSLSIYHFHSVHIIYMSIIDSETTAFFSEYLKMKERNNSQYL